MNDESKQPKEYDLVLGGNNPPPIDSLVLGGIDGLKLQFNNAVTEEKKISILKQAISYGEAGDAWLFDLIATEKNKIQWLAAVLLSHTKNEVYKQLLLEYFAEFIPNNINSWNEYTQNFTDLRINLKGIKLDNLTLGGTQFQNINFINSYITKTSLSDCNLTGVDFSQAELLHYSSFINSNLSRIKFTESNLCQTLWHWSDLKEIDFRRANLEQANFEGANLTQIDCSKSNLSKVDFNNAIFDRVKFNNAIFYGDDFEYASFKNVSFMNNNLTDIEFSTTKFEKSIFDNCQLHNSHFDRSKFNRTIFSNSEAENIDFRFADLKGVIFDRVNLKGADFRWSDLTGVDFTGLDVRDANFTRCTFGNNNLDKANTEGAKFSSIDSPRFPPNGLDTSNLSGALFDDQHYYEPGYE